jgi:tRNA splicing endonuclease
MPTDLAQVVAEKMQTFPIEKQQQVLEFVESIEEPTLNKSTLQINDKSAVEAIEKLLQDKDFPDRFSVLIPELQKNKWKVPIALTYPKHEPILLTDAFVDVRTGQVEMKISFDELFKKGKKKAKEVFSIA